MKANAPADQLGKICLPVYSQAGEIADELSDLAAALNREFTGLHLHLVSFPISKEL